MWIKEVFLGFIGLAGGLAVSAGIFAFAITLGIIPRFAGKTRTAGKILTYETVVFWGGLFGNLMTLFSLKLPLGMPMICIFGLCAGIYTGCLAMALAEILDVFPIMFRRTKLKTGQNFIPTAMALGKMLGALYFYYFHMSMN